MKKVVVLLLVVVLAIGMLSCAAPAAPAPASEAPDSAESAPASEAPAPASEAPAPAASAAEEKPAEASAAPLAADMTGKKIAFCYQDLETGFWVAAHEAIIAELGQVGCEVIEYNANEDANKQLEQVRDAIAAGVDGVIIIPQDGESAVTIAKECNRSGVPIGVFNRPPSDESAKNLVIVADNKAIAESCVDYMVEQAQIKFDATGEKLTPLIVVGNLGDPNAVYRKEGFYAAVEKKPELFNEVIEVDSKWDADVCLTNLTAAMQANPEVDFMFVSSDFLLPVVQSVLEPMDKWAVAGEDNHVILGALDGDSAAGELIDAGYLDGTGVQDLYYEADTLLKALTDAIMAGDKEPNEWMLDPGFALTIGNVAERHDDMWGNNLREY